ncbi:MAG: hypothetical protein E7069_03955 [Bacteroidales bacterium]|nr:hypothetical protein [Bacteroidales bacterium]
MKKKLPSLITIVYIVVWLFVFAIPPIYEAILINVGMTTDVSWERMAGKWIYILPIFILFLVNNFVFVPHILKHDRVFVYVVTTLISTFVVVFLCEIVFESAFIMPKMEADDGPKRNEWFNDRPKPKFDDMQFADKGTFDDRRPRPRMRGKGGDGIMFLFGRPIDSFLVHLLAAYLAIAVNTAISIVLRAQNERKRIAMAEKQTIEAELQYLKYQLSPHFFMNTLNNIHALVDVDAEKAKETILTLSQLMRYLLYETNQTFVPLRDEIDFIEHYVALMKLRYTKDVDVQCQMPKVVPNIMVPPLIFVVFVENAFKHGVSYQKHSFIHINIMMSGNIITFSCINSVAEKPPMNDTHHGVGLENAKKRLNLILPSRHNLTITQNEEHYDVVLSMSCECSS